ncbi:MAG: hypothetical protein Q9163_002875 [Psora crenata]
MPSSKCLQILFVDAYDSFTNNIVSLLEINLGVHVTVIKIDDEVGELAQFIVPFSAIIIGPGPGDPRNNEDVGLYRRFWELNDDHVIPILGICLGFQSLVLAFGGGVGPLPEPRHGLVRNVRHNGLDIFEGLVPLVPSVQYHSLQATLGDQQSLCVDDSSAKSDQPSADLIPLAWDLEADNISAGTPGLAQNPPSILMAVRHRSKHLHGIQFHPESICSSGSAQGIISNWWRSVRTWWNDRTLSGSGTHYELGCQSSLPSIRYAAHTTAVKQRVVSVLTKVIPSIKLTIPAICSRLGLAQDQVIVLDSENHQRAGVGQHSIIGLVSPDCLRIEHRVGTTLVRKTHHGQEVEIDLLRDYGGDIFGFLKDFMRQRKAQSVHKEIPFWGGLIGYINYEKCLDTINVHPPFDQRREHGTRWAPDLSFIFVERSIVVAHQQESIYIQSLVPGDRAWVESMACSLLNALPPSPPPSPFSSLTAQVTMPHESRYKASIRAAQAAIRTGDSYELCLTTHATIRTPIHLPSWPLYLRLRQINPAPFAAYIRFGGLTLLSSSPERFCSWTRPSERPEYGRNGSVCQFRPIKGTIARQVDPTSRPLTLTQAQSLLAKTKEMAENLMIVDLIRHDLHGVVGSGNVSVPKLMVVEEYETVFQLVSVVEGILDLPNNADDEDSYKQCHPLETRSSHAGQACESHGGTRSGIDVLAASLPPGSMTGAPKLRSCQLLQDLENRPRGVYSGVVGYLDVGGGGDFSVVIRSAVRWDGSYAEPAPETGMGNGPNDDNEAGSKNEEWQARNERPEEGDTWTIGAGGAITALSAEEEEYQEMMTKLRSTLRLFQDETTTYVESLP